MADRVTRAADAALEVALVCYARHVPAENTSDVMRVIEDLLVTDLGASRLAAVVAVNRALLQQVASRL
jgi:hypothetical protein